MNISVNLSFLIIVSSRYMPKSEIAGLYSYSIFSCLRNFLTVFHSDCASLHSHQPCRRFPFPPHLLACCLHFLMLAALISVRWHLTAVSLAVLTCASLTVGMLSVCAGCLSVFFGEASVQAFCPFSAVLFVFCH